MKRLFAYIAATAIAGGLALSAQAADAYIDTDGTQSIVLDYYVKPNTKIVADYAFLSVTPLQSRVFAASGREAGMSCAHYINGSGQYAFAFRNGDGDWSSTAITATTDRRTFEIDGPSKKARLYTDGELTKEMNTATPTVPSVYPLGLFATVKNAEGTCFENPGSKVRLYSLQAYESGTLVMDLQPVLKNGVYLLKDVVTGKTYGPVAGNPLTGGGDIATETGTIGWTGAESTDWNTAANWQVGGAASAQPPRAGDEVVIPVGSTVDISGAAARVKSLTVTGSGTVTLTGTNAKPLADSLVVASGTTLSLASGTTVYVPAATAGGASVPAGRHAGGSQGWLAGSGALNVNSAGQSLADGVLTFDVPAGQTLAYYTQLSSAITKIVKIGAGTAIVSNDNNTAFSGTVEIREGILEAQTAAGGQINTFGGKKANTITVSNGAQLRVLAPNSYPNQGTERFPNALVIAGNGPDGYGALRMIKTAQPVGGSGNIDRLFTTVTLSGDASVYSSGRVGFSNGTVDLGGHTLTTRPLESGGNMFMVTSATLKNGSCVAKNAADVITQGSPSFVGSPANTYTIESGSMFDLWTTTFSKFDWTLVLKGGAQVRVGAGTAENSNKIVGPIRLDGGTATFTTYSTTANMRQSLTGVISGPGKFQKSGVHDVYVTNPDNAWTGGTSATEGRLFATVTGSIPPGPIAASGSGSINFVAKDWDLPTLHNMLTNWNGSGAVNVYTASGENVTDNTDFEHAIPYRHGGPGTLTFTAGTTPEGKSKLIQGEGQMTISGNKMRRLSLLNVPGGTMTLENAGYIWAGEWDVDNDVSTLSNKTWVVGSANNTAPAKLIVKAGTTIDSKVVPAQKQAAYLLLRDTGTKGAILEVYDGAAITNTIKVSDIANSKSAMYQYGGDVRNLCHAGNDGWVGAGWKSYGYLDVMGGRFACRQWLGFGNDPSGAGVGRLSGGLFKVEVSCLCFSRGGWGEMYMTGGTLDAPGNAAEPGVRLGMLRWSGTSGASPERIKGIFTMDGEGNPYVKIGSASWFDLTERTNVFEGVVCLNAGVMETPRFQKSDMFKADRNRNGLAKCYITFNGGTFRSAANSSNIFGPTDLTADRVTVFPGGATLDVNGKTASNAAIPFEKPYGKGVASIAWPSGTATNNYLGAPEVVISGGGGTGAVAHCTFDARSGTIGKIVVVSPGWGYTSAPTATIKTADRATDIACAVTMTDGEEQPGGGLTLTNSSATAGTFTLSSANTYTGPTVVAGGTLKLGAADAIPSANEVRLAGGTFDAGSFTPSYARVGGYGTLKGNVTVTDKLVFDAAQPPSAGLTVNGSLTLGSGVTVEIANTNLLMRGTIHTLATLPTPLASVPASNLAKPWCVFLTNGGKTLKMHYEAGTMFLIK